MKAKNTAFLKAIAAAAVITMTAGLTFAGCASSPDASANANVQSAGKAKTAHKARAHKKPSAKKPAAVTEETAFPQQVGPRPDISTLYGGPGNMNRTWLLSSLTINGKKTPFSRNELESDMTQWFTLYLSDGTIYGVGAPNRFKGPYSAAPDGTMSIGASASTRMASLKSAPDLTETDFFAYLAGAVQWDFMEHSLIINSKTAKGLVSMKFTPFPAY
jgi:heat shock protein HslJ